MDDADAWGFVWFFALAGAAFGGALGLTARYQPGVLVEGRGITLDDEALVFQGNDGRSIRVPRRTIREAYIQSTVATGLATREAWEVVLVLADGGQIAPVLDARADADALLASLGFAPRQRTASFTIAPRLRRPTAVYGLLQLLRFTLVAVLYVSITSWTPAVARVLADRSAAHIASLVLRVGIVAAFALAHRAVRLMLRSRALVVGTDGVAIVGLWSRRFIPYREIQRIELAPEAIGIVTRRRTIRVLVSYEMRRPTGHDDTERFEVTQRRADARRDAIVDRIERARTAHAQEDASAALLDRGARSFGAWISDLRRLAQGSAHASSYRHAPPRADALTAIVERATASAERRIAAAVVLGASPDPAVRARVRVAASASASHDLRAALERALDGELDERAIARATRERR